jgi:hypothetical protein
MGKGEERVGIDTRKDLRVLCYQHHTEMSAKHGGELEETVLYACQEPGCVIRYDSSGYLMETEDAKTIEQEIMPRVSCPTDGHPMYLAEVARDIGNFRLWKCPECGASLTGENSSRGRGKTTGT